MMVLIIIIIGTQWVLAVIRPLVDTWPSTPRNTYSTGDCHYQEVAVVQGVPRPPTLTIPPQVHPPLPLHHLPLCDFNPLLSVEAQPLGM